MSNLNTLAVIQTYGDLVAIQERLIRSVETHGNPVKILEAGCGRSWPIRLEGLSYRITGVDIDVAALEYRKNIQKDLDEVVVGDLRTVDLGNKRFHVIYNSFVLEHIDGAQDVLMRFLDWLEPGGLLILKIPDPQSAQGFMTRITPHWFHVLYYRYIYGYKDAGTPGHGPYRTYYDNVVSRSGMHEFCMRNKIAILSEFGISDTTSNKSFKYKLVRLFRRGISYVTLGNISDRHINLLYVLKNRIVS